MAILTIIGAGRTGAAMSVPARDRGHEVRLVGAPPDADIIAALRAGEAHPTLGCCLPQGVSYYTAEQLVQALSGADAVIGGVSAFGVEWFGKNVLPLVPECVPVLLLARGLALRADGSLLTLPRALEAMLPSDRRLSIGAAGGSYRSDTLAQRVPSETVFCGRDIGAMGVLKAMLETDAYRITLSEDVRGVEVTEVLVNAYALGISLIEGLSQDSSRQEELRKQGVKEMQQLLTLLGGAPGFVGGEGETDVTALAEHARQLGERLGKGASYEQALEEMPVVVPEAAATVGRIASSLRVLTSKGMANIAEYPLLRQVDEMLARCAAPENAGCY